MHRTRTVKPLLDGSPIWGFLEAKMPKSGSRGKNTIPLLLYGVASTCMVRAVQLKPLPLVPDFRPDFRHMAKMLKSGSRGFPSSRGITVL